MDIMLFGKVQRIAVAVRQLRGILCCAGIYRAYIKKLLRFLLPVNMTAKKLPGILLGRNAGEAFNVLWAQLPGISR